MTRDRGTHTIIHTHAKTDIAKLDASGAVYPALLITSIETNSSEEHDSF